MLSLSAFVLILIIILIISFTPGVESQSGDTSPDIKDIDILKREIEYLRDKLNSLNSACPPCICDTTTTLTTTVSTTISTSFTSTLSTTFVDNSTTPYPRVTDKIYNNQTTFVKFLVWYAIYGILFLLGHKISLIFYPPSVPNYNLTWCMYYKTEDERTPFVLLLILLIRQFCITPYCILNYVLDCVFKYILTPLLKIIYIIYICLKEAIIIHFLKLFGIKQTDSTVSIV